MSWMPSYGLLLGGLTLWNYLFGLALSKGGADGKLRRLVFVAGAAGNLGCLCLFKYTNFIAEAIFHLGAGAAAFLHLPVSLGVAPLWFQIALPLGISFFAFEFIHYLTDVYRGSAAMVNSCHFALFAAFFPSQIAGPIKRFQDFQQQLLAKPGFDRSMFASGAVLVLQGMFKKVVLGDNLAQLVQPGFAGAAQLNGLDAWITVLAFTLQIYYDFSGYTDIGRGSAMLLGYRLPENFNLPYLARNLSDFWRRWHMSLSTWLRDYLYIPLGGSRGSGWQQMRNLVITMLLGGLWHGAAWHYVVWGAYHGAGLAVTHAAQRVAGTVPLLQDICNTRVWDVAARLATFLLVVLGWVVFRADNLPQAQAMYCAMLGAHGWLSADATIARLLSESVLPVGFLAYGFYLLLQSHWLLGTELEAAGTIQARWWMPPLSARAVAFLSVAIVIVCFAPHKAIPFIYFQF